MDRKRVNQISRFIIAGFIPTLLSCGNAQNDGLISDSTVGSCHIRAELIGSYVTLASGKFIMAKDPRYIEEGQPRQEQLDGFKILIHEVTNQQFQQFVNETQYVTEAEREGNRGSALFIQPKDDPRVSPWRVVQNTTWRTPSGPDSNLNEREQHPVIHVTVNDAQAYANWAGGRLPTEKEWEYAASLGLANPENQESGAFDNQGEPIANTWQGTFPIINTATDGYTGTSPVGCFKANEIGVYDMIGNVWEWTASVYRGQSNTIKGGSYLCASNFCGRYRPGARQPHERNFSSSHIGFRIVKDL